MNYSPLDVAVAISLYGYNVSPIVRARKLHDHFEGNCAELEDLVDVLLNRTHCVATELAAPTARVYVQHAIDRYGEEARYRNQIELEQWDMIHG